MGQVLRVEATPSGNAAAASLAWLRRELGLSDDVNSGSTPWAWHELREAMRSARGGQFLEEEHWPSDPWVARNSKRTFLGKLVPVWDPPEQMDEWPTLGVRAPEAPAAARTNHEAFCRVLTDGQPPTSLASQTALDRLALMQAEVRGHGDVRMTQIEQARAWLDTALGSMFMDVAVTYANQSHALTALARERLAQGRALNPRTPLIEFEDRRIEVVYNSRVSNQGGGIFFESSNTRTGQSQWWREHWRFLSREIGSQAILEAARVAAGLLCCAPLLEVLREALGSGDAPSSMIAMAVFRRWMLTLKAMSWLETALTHAWADVRPMDLALFAFNAVKPEWPRRVVAVSHRSADAKPTLVGMAVWNSARCAIDANYVPAWETNTGMVWSLFASAPIIARVRSVGYERSEWCRRELELTQYLLEQSDFLAERWVIDVQLPQLQELDRLAATWEDDAEEETDTRSTSDRRESFLGAEFPPLTQVWRLPTVPAWEADMLRAGAALRLINCKTEHPNVANGLAAYLVNSGNADQFGPPPTNNPGGWREYATIMRAAFCDEVLKSPLAVWLPPTYGARDQARDRELLALIPDLSTGVALRDLLLALEWLIVEWPFMVSQELGDKILVDCQGLSRKEWETQDALSLQRGVIALQRLPVPLWLLQTAGQDVERWPLVGERPIFTQHVVQQFSWMMIENTVDRSQAQHRYPQASGLMLADNLLDRCRG